MANYLSAQQLELGTDVCYITPGCLSSRWHWYFRIIGDREPSLRPSYKDLQDNLGTENHCTTKRSADKWLCSTVPGACISGQPWPVQLACVRRWSLVSQLDPVADIQVTPKMKWPILQNAWHLPWLGSVSLGSARLVPPGEDYLVRLYITGPDTNTQRAHNLDYTARLLNRSLSEDAVAMDSTAVSPSKINRDPVENTPNMKLLQNSHFLVDQLISTLRPVKLHKCLEENQFYALMYRGPKVKHVCQE